MLGLMMPEDSSSSQVESARIPVTVLTGFLGAGKTTALRRVLAQTDARRICVVENEFGAANVDGEVVETMAPGLVRRITGCICCAVQGDLVETFTGLAAVCAREGVERVVLETTGMAEPGEILRALRRDGPVARAFRVAQVVTVVDAEHAWVDLENSPVAQEQVALADLLLLTKTDRVSAAKAARVRETLVEANPAAALQDAPHGSVDAARFFADAAPRRFARAVGRHDHGDLTSVVVTAPGPHRVQDARRWVSAWSRALGDDLLRVKGIVCGPASRRTLVQSVRRVVTTERLQAGGATWSETTFVVIGRGLPSDDLASSLRALPRAGAAGSHSPS